MSETGIPISTTPTNIPKPSVDQSNHALLEELYRKMHQAKLEAEAAKKEADDARKQLTEMRKERIEAESKAATLNRRVQKAESRRSNANSKLLRKHL
ncbi:hypothetical protein GCK72_003414 [Caenorhabditis remanei]|uniref:Uncharacterized protein n=1 Tax=Caenorhabditis remanei TaxID=31234 RepID=A0A6A5HY61_CAERE|nr:hypothetical protein GCK72_003414 [Caenorhabditis remanei]KAF1771587.1 hypothetical protein GCK72_003414 [Caenorhabditis remanei]